jgi:hypothetical protein
MSMMRQANAVLNALDEGKVAGFITYQEALNPGIEKEALEKAVRDMLKLVKMKPELIEHWIGYFFP